MDNSSQKGPAPRFSLRTLLEVMTVAAFLLFLVYVGVAQIMTTGRFQMFRGPANLGTDQEATFLFDTRTGDVWIANGDTWPRRDRQMPASSSK